MFSPDILHPLLSICDDTYVSSSLLCNHQGQSLRQGANLRGVHLETQYGLGRHLDDLPDFKNTYTKYLLVCHSHIPSPRQSPDTYHVLQVSAFGVTGTYPIANFFTKFSILSFYLRFTTSRCFTYTVYLTIALVLAFNFVGLTGVLYWCQPIETFWKHWEGGKCVKSDTWYISLLGINVVADIIILLLPIFIIRPLRVAFAQKVAIGAILGTGGL